MSHLSQPGAITTAGPMTKLFDSTLGADSASIDTGAGGFSQLYDHLRIYILVRTTEAAVFSSINMLFNNDSGANYDSQVIRVINATVTGVAIDAGNTALRMNAPGSSAVANTFGPITMDIPSYTQTVAHKVGNRATSQMDTSLANEKTEVGGFKWRSTAAISRVSITAGSGNLVAGTRMTVYGL